MSLWWQLEGWVFDHRDALQGVVPVAVALALGLAYQWVRKRKERRLRHEKAALEALRALYTGSPEQARRELQEGFADVPEVERYVVNAVARRS